VRFDEDEIGIPDAEPTGVNGPTTVSAHDDGPSLSIAAQQRSISRTKAVIGWMSVEDACRKMEDWCWHPNGEHLVA